jgi:hypothetical protein
MVTLSWLKWLRSRLRPEYYVTTDIRT